MNIRLVALAGLAAGLTVTALTVIPSAALEKDPYQCYTDDGYGRYRPCDSLYKRHHPNWRNGPECMTNDGFGHMRPCGSAGWQGGSPGWQGYNGPAGQYPGAPQAGTQRPPGY